MAIELIGWISAIILAMTISRQVYTQWKTKSCEGVSPWLFVGQLAASIGFVAYSFLVDNWVFVVTNFFNAVAALIGQGFYLRNRRAGKSETKTSRMPNRFFSDKR
jgi:uncharacterized protein with PQ loop repeat